MFAFNKKKCIFKISDDKSLSIYEKVNIRTLCLEAMKDIFKCRMELLKTLTNRHNEDKMDICMKNLAVMITKNCHPI